MEHIGKSEVELNKDKILAGVNALANNVKVTLGAKGRNVMFRDAKSRKTRITKDGVTVAKQVSSNEAIQQMAIEIVRAASEETVKTSGDGTTTTLILAQFLINEGFKLIQNGLSMYELSRQIDSAVERALEEIKSNSLDITDDFDKLLNIATISSNSKEIGEYLFKVMEEIGVYGHIEVKPSSASKTRVQKIAGIKYHKGFYAPHFLNDMVKEQWRVQGAFIVIVDDVVRQINDLNPYINAINSDEHGNLVYNHPILFICNEVDPTALHTLIQNKLMRPKDFNIMITEHDGFGDRRTEIMNDIAAMTGAVVGNFTDLPGTIGRAKEIIVTESTTSIIGGSPNPDIVNELINITKAKLQDEEISELDALYYNRRLATLAGGVAVIHVGAPTEVEMKEKKDRIDDAVEALRASIARGVSIGGGYRFLQTARILEEGTDPDEGTILLSKALRAPFKQLCDNANVPVSVHASYLNEISKEKSNKGFDVIENALIPLEEYQVYDPTGVLIDSLNNAVSVAKSILSIERALV